jgi:hypothetical protein
MTMHSFLFHGLRRCARLALPFVLTAGLALELAAAPVAFPGAEGAGRFATGGRGGAVLFVTNLNDSGPGSLRAAIDASGPRTVVFRVSGTIQLQSDLRIRNDNITIAGQSAPGDGICLANYSLLVSADNVIIRFLRMRVGDLGGAEGADGRDAMFCRYTNNVIIDHCSFSWSIDETASAYFNTNFTMQWCILSESLRFSLHSKNAHGYAGIWGGQGASFHHNLLAHHTSRNPRLNGSRDMPATHNGIAFTREEVDLRNNVIYNWSSNSAYGGEPRSDGLPSLYNFIGNTFKAGPATPSSRNDRIFQPTAVNGVYSLFHLAGNHTTASAATTADNWLGIDGPSSSQKEAMRLTDAVVAAALTEQEAARAYEYVLAFAGASLRRDSHDARIVEEVRTGTATYGVNGIIDSQSQVGGWPLLQSLPAPLDSDNDGMPDAWELARGLNPHNAADRNHFSDDSGYTNLELYLNGLVNHLFPVPTLSAEAGEGALSVAWSNQLNDRQVEVSDDLAGWVPAAGDTGGSEGLASLPVPPEGTPRFVRLGKKNSPPQVSLQLPAAESTFVEGAAVTLAASASDLDGEVVGVEFFIGGSSVGTVSAPPYQLGWTAAGDGRHEFRVVATDDRGSEGNSETRSLWILRNHVGPGTLLHAETGTRGPGSVFERSNGGFRGSGYINFASVSTLTFEGVDGGAGGTAQLRIRYALGTAPRTGALSVNGTTPVLSVTFPSTASWSTWEELVLDVPLNAGPVNKLELVAIGEDLANVDEIIVIPGG